MTKNWRGHYWSSWYRDQPFFFPPSLAFDIDSRTSVANTSVSLPCEVSLNSCKWRLGWHEFRQSDRTPFNVSARARICQFPNAHAKFEGSAKLVDKRITFELVCLNVQSLRMHEGFAWILPLTYLSPALALSLVLHFEIQQHLQRNIILYHIPCL